MTTTGRVMQVSLGAYMRVDIPDETDPDFEFHGEHGVIIDRTEQAGMFESGWRYRIALDTSEVVLEVEHWELRPPLQAPPRQEKLI